jgi:hypothetical protein
MNQKYQPILAIAFTGIWINASEFLRNEVLLKSYWLNHYQSLGLTFPSAPINGAVWMVWGFIFATSIYLLSQKFSLLQTAIISWLIAFVLMWIALWNLNVLPSGILVYAVPLSLLECLVGAYICHVVRQKIS